MSEPDEDVTVEENGVSVRKSLNDDQFETLAVVFDVRSERDEASTVTLVDTVPDDVPVDDIGFHPEYGVEHWHADGGEVVFSRTFEPGEQYTTVYGIRDFDGERDGLLVEPTVETGVPAVGVDEPTGGGMVRDVEAIDALVSEEDSQVVREVISGERDTLPGLEEGTAAGAGAGPSSSDEPAEAEAAPGPADGDAPDEAGTAAGPTDGDDVADVDLPEPGEVETDEAETDDGEPAGLGDAVTDLTDDVIEADADGDDPVDEDESIDEDIAALGADGPADADEPAETDAEEAPEVAAADEGGEEATEPGDGAVEVGEAEPPGDEDAEEPETGVGAVMQDVGEGGAPSVDEDVGASAAGEPAAPGTDGPADDEPVEAADAAADDEITVPVTGGIARVLAKELRAGNVSYEDRRLLREELLPDDGSTDARIQHLQNKVADLEAYTEALEQFLDEEGGAQAALSRVEERVDSLAGDVEAVEGSLDGVDDEVGALRDEVADVEDDVDDVEEEVEAVDAQVSAVSGDVERVADDVARFEDDLASVRGDLDRIDEVDRRVGGVEDDVSAIHDELEELATFRDRLSSVFGAGGMGGGGDEESEG